VDGFDPATKLQIEALLLEVGEGAVSEVMQVGYLAFMDEGQVTDAIVGIAVGKMAVG
jgi:hypothetical protein